MYMMKNYLLIVAALSLFVLSACTKEVNAPEQAVPQTVPEQTAWVETNTEQVNPLSNIDPIMLKETIAKYLATADLKGKWDVVVKAGDKISVQYIGRLNDSEVFDTSVESIAKASGKYSSARNYNEWLSFTVAAGQMIAGFDKGVVGMKLWQTKTITIPAKEAYGEWTGAALITVPRSQLPEGEYTKGIQLMSANGQSFTVYEVKDDSVVLDGNHELAGKDLIFDITVIKIN